MEHKCCTKCGKDKPVSEFSYKRAKGRKPGLQPRCKTCCASDTRDWYKRNKNTARERYLQTRYGMSENEYAARLLAQNNCCILCGTEFSAGDYGPNSPVVDHCHTHGHVRGILCNECNRGLGYFHDNPSALRAAAKYIEEN